MILSKKRIKKSMENETRVVILTADNLTLGKLSYNGYNMRDIAIMHIAGCSERKNIRYKMADRNWRAGVDGILIFRIQNNYRLWRFQRSGLV